MAKPPGKLVKNLNLLSGGEKAGTGIAFVFNIPHQPGTFLLLDEVDALDEANNERFWQYRKRNVSICSIYIYHT